MQEIFPTDFETLVSFSTKLMDLVTEDEGVISHLIMSDEVHFHLNGFINKHNRRVWTSENPRLCDTSRTARVTMAILREPFPNRVISLFESI